MTVDIAYQYLKFFLEDDERLAEIGDKYEKGKMLTGEVKKELIKVVQKFIADHQEGRKKITMEVIEQFLSTHPRKYVQK